MDLLFSKISNTAHGGCWVFQAFQNPKRIVFPSIVHACLESQSTGGKGWALSYRKIQQA